MTETYSMVLFDTDRNAFPVGGLEVMLQISTVRRLKMQQIEVILCKFN